MVNFDYTAAITKIRISHMQQTYVRGYTLFKIICVVLTLSFVFSPITSPLAQDASITLGAGTSAKANNDVINVTALMKDRILGNPDAPVTIIEYASMTCIHCANFHNNVYPAVKAELIETGKVKFILREFPLDGVALRASMMARCAPEDKFFGLVEVLFANQKRWVGADDPVAAMSKLGKLAGLTDARIQACLANTDLETALLKTRQDASSTYDVRSTPTFVFNNGAEVESGVLQLDRIQKIVNKLTR